MLLAFEKRGILVPYVRAARGLAQVGERQGVREPMDAEQIETREWLDSLRDVIKVSGPERARRLLTELDEFAHQQGVDLPYTATTPYINTIPVDDQPLFPGNREIERRIKSIVRWNAMAMVVRANRDRPEHRRTYLHLRLLGHALRGRLQPLLARGHRRASRRPDLLPGPRRPGHLRPGLRGGTPRGRATQQLPPRAGAGRRPVLLPAPLAHAGLLAVPHRVHGPGPHHVDLPRPVHPLPGEPRPEADRATRRSGPCSATARRTNRSRSAPSPWPRGNGSTT